MNTLKQQISITKNYLDDFEDDGNPSNEELIIRNQLVIMNALKEQNEQLVDIQRSINMNRNGENVVE